MSRFLCLLLAPLGVMLVIGLAHMIVNGYEDRTTPYSVATLHEDLVQHPSVWIGRTVWVRGVLDGCPQACPGHERWSIPMLFEPNRSDSVDPLLVAWMGLDPVKRFFRGLPVIGGLVPNPQHLHWEAVATYRVQLRAVPANACPFTSCYEALLLDAVSA
jgi:hypothetical protein